MKFFSLLMTVVSLFAAFMAATRIDNVDDASANAVVIIVCGVASVYFMMSTFVAFEKEEKK